MRDAENAAFARGVEVETLMDQAGAGVAHTVAEFFPNPGTCVVFAGKGHNGGDALVAAERLKRAGWKIEVCLAFGADDCSELTRKKLDALRRVDRGSSIGSPTTKTLNSRPPLIVLDGLLGLGAKPPLRGPIRAACREINQLRQEKSAYVFGVDIPTGLD